MPRRLRSSRSSGSLGRRYRGAVQELRSHGRVLVAALVGAGVLSIASCGSTNSGRANPASSSAAVDPAGGTVAERVIPAGFGTASVVIRRADGSVCVLCTYLARTSAERQRGLMGVTDLAGLDGMLFDFDGPSVDRFWMRNTVMPLTAVWFAPDGSFLDAQDMAPCPDTSTSCPTYGPGLPADSVLELLQGDDKRLGIGAGAVLESVGGPCTAADHASTPSISSQ